MSSAKFSYFGGMCVLVEREDGFKILFDPYLTGCDETEVSPKTFYDVDVVCVTHAAFDHYGDLEEIMANSNALLLAGGDVRRMLKKAVPEIDGNRLLRTVYGDEKRFGETTIRPVNAIHVSASNPEGVHVIGTPYGFICNVTDDICYYHTGDTFINSDMNLIRDLYRPNVMVVGISSAKEGLPCELTVREAAKVVEIINPEVVIPTHYTKGNTKLDLFKQYVEFTSPRTLIKDGFDFTFKYVPSRCEEENSNFIHK